MALAILVSGNTDSAGNSPVRVGVPKPAIGREKAKQKLTIQTRAVSTDAVREQPLGRCLELSAVQCFTISSNLDKATGDMVGSGRPSFDKARRK